MKMRSHKYEWLEILRSNLISDSRAWAVLFKVCYYLEVTEDCVKTISLEDWSKLMGGMESSVKSLYDFYGWNEA